MINRILHLLLRGLKYLYHNLFVKSHEDLKSIILDQLYPAFLGTYIFLVFDKIFEPIRFGIEYIGSSIVELLDKGPFAVTESSYNEHLAFKYILLLIALVFYYSDYRYIKYTKIYKGWFFVFDFIFLVLFLATVKFTKIEIDGDPHINIFGIITCYTIFLFLYLIWDACERVACSEKGTPFSKKLIFWRRKEYSYYNRVILWEGISIIILVYLLCKITINTPPSSAHLIWLALITLAFALLAIEKKRYYHATSVGKL